MTALMYAAANGHKDIARMLIENGADKNKQHDNNKSGQVIWLI